MCLQGGQSALMRNYIRHHDKKLDNIRDKLDTLTKTLQSPSQAPWIPPGGGRRELEVWPHPFKMLSSSPSHPQSHPPAQFQSQSVSLPSLTQAPAIQIMPSSDSEPVQDPVAAFTEPEPLQTRVSPSSHTQVLPQMAHLPANASLNASFEDAHSRAPAPESKKITVRMGHEEFSVDPMSVPDVPNINYSQKLDELFKHWESTELGAHLVIGGRGIPVKYWPEFYNKRKGMTKESSWDKRKGQWGKWRVRKFNKITRTIVLRFDRTLWRNDSDITATAISGRSGPTQMGKE